MVTHVAAAVHVHLPRGAGRMVPAVAAGRQHADTLGLVGASRSAPAAVGGGGRSPSTRYLTDEQFAALLRLARGRRELAWPAGQDISAARNAHFTNTAREMAAALQADYDWIEGDVRLDDHGKPVMAHEPGARHSMALDEWLAIGAASGRGLKLDFKDPRAIESALRLLRAHGVPGWRLILNVTVGGPSGVTWEQLATARRRFPDAIVNLSTDAQELTPTVIGQLRAWARAVGHNVMFPLRWDLVDDQVIAALRDVGRIAIWNSPAVGGPSDLAAEVLRLRARGVDGMIDLRPGSGMAAIGGAVFDALVGALGRDGALRVVHAATWVLGALAP